MNRDRPERPETDEIPDVAHPASLLFVGFHLLCFAALWTGATTTSVIIFVMLYFVRMLAVTAGYHRYFSHRSFRLGRVTQFVLAFLAQSSGQGSAIWWASVHRMHHARSDTPRDVHSPIRHGFWHAHFGWILRERRVSPLVYGRLERLPAYSTYSRLLFRFFSPRGRARGRRISMVRDLMQYREMRMLHRYTDVPLILTGIGAYLVGGLPGLIVGFVWSTVLVYHATFSINSIAHLSGEQPYATNDESRNNWLVVLITLGDGWHNNHHHDPAAAQHGSGVRQWDPTFWVLRLLSYLMIVKDLRLPKTLAPGRLDIKTSPKPHR